MSERFNDLPELTDYKLDKSQMVDLVSTLRQFAQEFNKVFAHIRAIEEGMQVTQQNQIDAVRNCMLNVSTFTEKLATKLESLEKRVADLEVREINLREGDSPANTHMNLIQRLKVLENAVLNTGASDHRPCPDCGNWPCICTSQLKDCNDCGAKLTCSRGKHVSGCDEWNPAPCPSCAPKQGRVEPSITHAGVKYPYKDSRSKAIGRQTLSPVTGDVRDNYEPEKKQSMACTCDLCIEKAIKRDKEKPAAPQEAWLLNIRVDRDGDLLACIKGEWTYLQTHDYGHIMTSFVNPAALVPASRLKRAEELLKEVDENPYLLVTTREKIDNFRKGKE